MRPPRRLGRTCITEALLPSTAPVGEGGGLLLLALLGRGLPPPERSIVVQLWHRQVLFDLFILACVGMSLWRTLQVMEWVVTSGFWQTRRTGG